MLNKIRKWYYDKKQSRLNNDFKKNGFSEKLFKKQVKLNEKRNKHNIPDSTKLNKEGYTQ